MNENNEIKSEIQSISKRIIKISNIASVICIIGSIGAMIGGIICAVFGFTNVGTDFINNHPESIQSLSVGYYTSLFTIRDTALEFSDYRSAFKHFTGECFAGVVMLILVVVMLYFMKKVFRKIAENGSPFNYDLLHDLKIMFVMITIICIEFSLALGIIIGFVMICLVKIFRYGCQLQKESDETL